MRKVFHALMLNLHQPAGNLQGLLESNEWEAKEILWALDRMPRALWGYEDVARVHLSLSGTLLETLANPVFQERVFGIVKCGDLLWHLQNREIFDLLGTGYYHPVLALIPPADWEEHLTRWLGLGKHLFWRTDFHGFWPPEMGFCMELIPLLKRLGYRYVMVDSHYVEPLTPMRWEELRYRPHVAKHGGEEIIVVVRDRELSDAQLSGMDAGWFMHELHERTQFCSFPPLVLTATDGDNGGWFRNVSEKGNFWYVCYREMLDWVRRGDTEVEPIFIHDYLDRFGTHGEVTVRTGAWNTGWHHGADFLQWTGSQAQKDALGRIHELSRALHAAIIQACDAHADSPAVADGIEQARWRLLRAETSCNLFWGEAWVPRIDQDLAAARAHLETVTAAFPEAHPKP
ncbi:MAG: glycoside hydrolase family 57 [Verrucomicrobia bacterium]|nr:glycoside hydrolase family 57 [Verrucomicrobiota bacterium]